MNNSVVIYKANERYLRRVRIVKGFKEIEEIGELMLSIANIAKDPNGYSVYYKKTTSECLKLDSLRGQFNKKIKNLLGEYNYKRIFKGDIVYKIETQMKLTFKWVANETRGMVWIQ